MEAPVGLNWAQRHSARLLILVASPFNQATVTLCWRPQGARAPILGASAAGFTAQPTVVQVGQTSSTGQAHREMPLFLTRAPTAESRMRRSRELASLAQPPTARAGALCRGQARIFFLRATSDESQSRSRQSHP